MTELSSQIHEHAARRLQIDPRALAWFRIALAGLLLFDLVSRLPDLVAFHTDQGVMPRSTLAESYPLLRWISVHALSGSVSVQAGLFLVAGLTALCLAAGYRTTLATGLSWYLLLSLQARNPVVLNGGDLMLLALLFFGLFLPLGARYSVDAIRGCPRTDAVSGLATEAPLLYVVGLVYLVNGVSRTRGEAWLDGTAVKQVYQIESLTRPAGDLLAEQTALLVAANWLWFGMLALAPVLILLTGWRRMTVIGAFAGVHAGMLLTLELSLFPLVNIAALLLFVPADVLDAAADWTPGSIPEVPREWVPAGLRTTPKYLLPTAVRSRASVLSSVLLTTALVVGFGWAIVAVAPPISVGDVTIGPANTGYPWAVFSPEPLSVDGYYVAPASLETGERVDALRGGAVDWDRPPDLSAVYPRTRWVHYMLANANRLYAANQMVQDGFADYLCHRVADRSDQPPESVTVYFISDPVDGVSETRLVAQRSC